MVNSYIRRGVAAAGQWIEDHGCKSDYSGDHYEGPAWIIFPDEVEALKRGDLPRPKESVHLKRERP